MKLSDIEATKDTYTGKLSDFNRTLVFAGIAVLWVFKIQNGISVSLPEELLTPLLFFVLSLAFDLLQYLYLSIVWHILLRGKEKEKKDPDFEFDAPKNRVIIFGYIFFYAKVASSLVAYSFVFFFIWKMLVQTCQQYLTV